MTARQIITTFENSSSAQSGRDSQSCFGVAGPPPSRGSIAVVRPAGDYVGLRIWAESYADMQQTRIGLVNRMERGGVDADLLAGHRRFVDASENDFRLSMVRSYRRLIRADMPGVEVWQKTMFGIGEHLLARLIGHLGHPVYATPYVWTDEAPPGHVCDPGHCGKRHLVAVQPFARSVRQLWAYCGHGAAVRRAVGMSQADALGLGSARCKMLVHLLAEATIKVTPPKVQPIAIVPSAGSGPESTMPATANGVAVRDRFSYRRIYDNRKAATVNRDWTDGHRHADALRIVGKEILRDLWTAAHAQEVEE